MFWQHSVHLLMFKNYRKEVKLNFLIHFGTSVPCIVPSVKEQWAATVQCPRTSFSTEASALLKSKCRVFLIPNIHVLSIRKFTQEVHKCNHLKPYWWCIMHLGLGVFCCMCAYSLRHKPLFFFDFRFVQLPSVELNRFSLHVFQKTILWFYQNKVVFFLRHQIGHWL